MLLFLGISRPIHVTSEFNMNFVQKNFKYATLDVGEVISKASSRAQDPEKYYLRAVSEENPRLKPVSFGNVYDFELFFLNILNLSFSMLKM